MPGFSFCPAAPIGVVLQGYWLCAVELTPGWPQSMAVGLKLESGMRVSWWQWLGTESCDAAGGGRQGWLWPRSVIPQESLPWVTVSAD